MVVLLLQSLFPFLQHNWLLLFRSVLAGQQYVVSEYNTLVLVLPLKQIKMLARKKILLPTNVTRTQGNKT